MTLYAGVRHEQLDFASLRASEAHGRRLDRPAHIDYTAKHTSLAVVFDGEQGKLTGRKVLRTNAAKRPYLGLENAFKAFKKHHGARE